MVSRILTPRAGFGPENTNIATPAPGTYRIGVHYFGSHGTPATADAYVNVYCGVGSTTPIASFGPVTLHDTSGDNDFWRVADVALGSGACTVTPLFDTSGAPNVRPASDAMLRR